MRLILLLQVKQLLLVSVCVFALVFEVVQILRLIALLSFGKNIQLVFLVFDVIIVIRADK